MINKRKILATQLKMFIFKFLTPVAAVQESKQKLRVIYLSVERKQEVFAQINQGSNKALERLNFIAV